MDTPCHHLKTPQLQKNGGHSCENVLEAQMSQGISVYCCRGVRLKQVRRFGPAYHPSSVGEGRTGGNW